MHSWVGSNFNVRREDMGAFYYVAREPSFYAQHSNVDRLWEVWKQIYKVGLQTFDPYWLNSSFYFHDENSQLVRIKVRDVLDTIKLRYVYEEVDLVSVSHRSLLGIDYTGIYCCNYLPYVCCVVRLYTIGVVRCSTIVICLYTPQNGCN
ncbi:putative catechol oxidase [Rosa chinensis]|uniref:Putative catechol oxidase n=1 Tax=Rosa chinensis TaxID=74649 RepID=A0A2P6PPA3_ROSCH|nr:putative catechol oxidase [Rosa chinensis]